MNERLEISLKWCKDNVERLKTKPKWNYQSNKKTRFNYNKYHREYRSKNIKNMLDNRIKCLINYSLRRSNIKREGKSWRKLLDYSAEELINRLNDTIPEGYTWNDFLEGKLDIDHIKPVMLFNFNSPNDNEFKKCWSLNNLRLLSVSDNRSRRFNLITL